MFGIDCVSHLFGSTRVALFIQYLCIVIVSELAEPIINNKR